MLLGHTNDLFGAQVTAVAVQVMEVVHGVKDNDWLVKLLRGMICGPGAGNKQKKVGDVTRCNDARKEWALPRRERQKTVQVA